MSQELYLGQVYSEIASEVWDELKETYDKMDGSVIFNLVHKINELKQGDLSVPEYYHKLNSLWREFDILTLLPACTCAAHEDTLKHNQLVRLMQFLMGLNDVYQNVRSNLLSRDPLPDVKDAFAVVSREESHRGFSPGSLIVKSVPAAFTVKNNANNSNNSNSNSNSNNRRGNTNNNRGPNPNLLCKHCGLIGHTIDRCFELNGYPPGFKRNPNLVRQNGANKRFNASSDLSQNLPSTSGSLSGSFTNDQMVKLLSLINEKPAVGASTNMAGIKPSFLNHNVFFNLNIERFCCSNTGGTGYNVTLGWIIDSGANQHMTNSTTNMFNVVDITSLMLTVGHPNGTMAKVVAIGSLKLTNNIVLFDVLVVPDYNVSLLSVNKMIKDSKFFVGFDEQKCYIQDLNLGKIVGTGSQSAGLYLFDGNTHGEYVSGLCNSGFICYVSRDLWHCRLGHPADQVMNVLQKTIGFRKGDQSTPCDICHKAKQTREPFPLSDHKSVSIGDLIHCDIWGPYRVTSRDGFRYFLTIVDDFSRAVWVYLLKSKMEVCEYIENFIKLIFTQFEKRVKIVRSDNGTEFVNNKMSILFNNLGIIHQTSCAYTPQQNGIAERKHRHLLNVARSLMFQGGFLCLCGLSLF